MAIKILGGDLRGLPLFVPKGQKIRPTGVLLKRRVFDSRQNWHDRIVVDLCAGTGSFGLEALSRGATKAYFIEYDREVFGILKQNIEKSLKGLRRESIEGVVESSHNSAQKWLKNQMRELSENFDNMVVFLDPPYKRIEVYKKSLRTLQELNFTGEIWIESDDLKGISWQNLEKLFPLEKLSYFEQGDSYICLAKFLKSGGTNA
jgi:16S rRNA (guanine(966)-N(2))-methyltransferase RsmD